MLNRILGPKQLFDFFENYWCNKPIALKPVYYPVELSVSEADIYKMYLGNAQVRTNFTSFSELHPEKRNQRNRIDRLFSQRGNKLRLLEQLAKKEALIIRDLTNQTKWRDLCMKMDRFMRSPCTLNCYLVTNGADHFPLHQDPHHILAFQSEGKKRWYMWKPSVIAPMKNYKWKKEPPWIEDPMVYEVNEGEIMYIPLGWRHLAETIDSVSIHFSMGLQPRRWIDLLQDLAELMGAKHFVLRETIPFSVNENAITYAHRELKRETHSIFDFTKSHLDNDLKHLIDYYNQTGQSGRENSDEKHDAKG